MSLTPIKGAKGAWQEFPCSSRNNWDNGLCWFYWQKWKKSSFHERLKKLSTTLLCGSQRENMRHISLHHLEVAMTLAWSLPLWWEIYTKKPTITITKPIYHYKVKEKGGTCRVLGCDGTGVNTGIHNGDEWKLLDYELKSGALRVIQLELGVECQQIVCQLHLNELFLRHRQVSFLLFGNCK